MGVYCGNEWIADIEWQDPTRRESCEATTLPDESGRNSSDQPSGDSQVVQESI